MTRPRWLWRVTSPVKPPVSAPLRAIWGTASPKPSVATAR